MKEEGISYIERDCPWQAIGRWDEALDIKLPSGSTPKDFGHEKILDMKAQALISLHEWEPAIETSYSTLKIEPNWWPAHQTLGRAYLGFGKLQQAVNVSLFKICKKLNTFIDVISLQSFSRAVHLCPDNEELRFEDLSWAHDLLLREKLGNREWKPIKDPEPKGEDSDEEYMIEEDGERTKILPTSFRS